MSHADPKCVLDLIWDSSSWFKKRFSFTLNANRMRINLTQSEIFNSNWSKSSFQSISISILKRLFQFYWILTNIRKSYFSWLWKMSTLYIDDRYHRSSNASYFDSLVSTRFKSNGSITIYFSVNLRVVIRFRLPMGNEKTRRNLRFGVPPKIQLDTDAIFSNKFFFDTSWREAMYHLSFSTLPTPFHIHKKYLNFDIIMNLICHGHDFIK